MHGTCQHLWGKSFGSCKHDISHSILRKKSNSIAFHFVREGSAKDEWRTAYVNLKKKQQILLRSPFLQGRSVQSSLVCFCTISKIQWFVGGVEVRLHLNHSVFCLFDIAVDVRLVPNHEFSESMIGFIRSHQWVL